jgi:predicted acyl esterase
MIHLSSVLAFFALLLAPRLLHPQAQPNPVAQYFATRVDREDMVRIPMRDGAQLNASFFFPKAVPREKLPTILVFFPYYINPASWPENQRFLEAGYALAVVNVRAAPFEGIYLPGRSASPRVID